MEAPHQCPHAKKILPYLGPRPKAEKVSSSKALAVQRSSFTRSPTKLSEASTAPITSPVGVSPSSVAAFGTSSTTAVSSQASPVSAVGGLSSAAASHAGVQCDIEPSTAPPGTPPGTPLIVSLKDSTRDTIDLARKAGRKQSRRNRESPSETEAIDARRKTRDTPTRQVVDINDEKNDEADCPRFASLKKVHAIELAQLDKRYQSEREALKKKHFEELEYRIRLADQLERSNDADEQRLAELQKIART